MENVSGSASINDALLPVLQEISNAIVVADNLSTISHLMLDLAIRHTGAEKGSLMLINGHQELYIHSAQGLDYLLARSYRVKLGEGIAGMVAKSGEPMMVADIEADERFRGIGRDRYATRSFISCPIKGMEKVLGVLNINDKRDGAPFTADDFALVRIIAGQAGIALKNSLLVKKFKDKTADLEEANRKLIDADIGRSEFLTRISHELRTPLNAIKGSVYHLQNSGELQPLLQKEFFDIIGRETGKLIAIVEKQLDFLRFEDEDRVLRKSIIYLREILTGICHSRTLRNALSKKNIQLDLDLGEEAFNVVGDKVMVNQLLINLLEGLAHFLDRGSRIVISVRETGSIVARFHVSSRLPEDFLNHHFTFNDLFLNEQSEGAIKIFLARKAAEAHGWQLIGGKQQDDFFITLTIPMVKRHRVEAAINATLEMILEFTSELFGANTCSLMLADELSGDLVINCARGLDEEIIRRTRISVPSRIAGWVAQEGKPLLVKDIETDPRFRKRNLDAQYNTKSLLSFPLKAGERILGVLNLNNKKSGEPFTDRDLRVGTLLLERVTAFVENLYTDSWTDEELGRLLQSLDSLINAERKYP
jgi:GAF domain-containing protein